MRKQKTRIFLALISCIMVISSSCGPKEPQGFAGKVYERIRDGRTGPTISGVQITFVKEDGSASKSVRTDTSGSFRIWLNLGRYYVTATHQDYEDYSSAPGLAVVTGDDYQTYNIILGKPRITTILLVRHAEKDTTVPGDREIPLSAAGRARARTLAHVTENAGVTAIYTTVFSRTQQTVLPLANQLRIVVDSEDSADTLVNDMILARDQGDVVLVASHSGSFPGGGFISSVPGIIEELGAVGCTGSVFEYDNLYIVSRRVGDVNSTNVVNLQYGSPHEPVTPDSVECSNPMTTVLLVRHVSEDIGSSVGEMLAHMTRKANVRRIYDTGSTWEPTKSLARRLGLTVTLYDPREILELIDEVLDGKGNTFIVAVDRDTLGEIIELLGGSPYPIIPRTENDDLFVVTIDESGQAKVINLQFGAASP